MLLGHLQQTTADVSRRQHTSAYVSIRQHTSAYVSIRLLLGHLRCEGYARQRQLRLHEGAQHLQQTTADVSIRQQTSAYVSIRQHTSAYVNEMHARGSFVCTSLKAISTCASCLVSFCTLVLVNQVM
jgi:hypothetical protein